MKIKQSPTLKSFLSFTEKITVTQARRCCFVSISLSNRGLCKKNEGIFCIPSPHLKKKITQCSQSLRLATNKIRCSDIFVTPQLRQAFHHPPPPLVLGQEELSPRLSCIRLSLAVTSLCLFCAHKQRTPTCSLTEARMAEVVSDSEPSPLDALRTGLNMAAALAVSEATSGTGIPPGKQAKTTLLYFS